MTAPAPRHRSSPRRSGRGTSFGLITSLLAADTGVAVLNPAVGTVLLACEAAIPLIILIIAVIGPSATGERAFRLLRWMTDRPEPPAPAHSLNSQRTR